MAMQVVRGILSKGQEDQRGETRRAGAAAGSGDGTSAGRYCGGRTGGWILCGTDGMMSQPNTQLEGRDENKTSSLNSINC